MGIEDREMSWANVRLFRGCRGGWMDGYPPGLPGLLVGFASYGWDGFSLAASGCVVHCTKCLPVTPGRLYQEGA